MLAVKTRFIPPTNFRGGRILATCGRESILHPGGGSDADVRAAKKLVSEKIGDKYVLVDSFELGETESTHIFVHVEEIPQIVQNLILKQREYENRKV